MSFDAKLYVEYDIGNHLNYIVDSFTKTTQESAEKIKTWQF